MKKTFDDRKSMKVNVYNTLKNAIQYLEMKPGSAVNEDELSAEIGVSRTPIREALIRLSDDLLIEIYPQKGTYVSKLDLNLAKEMAYMRHVIETDVCLELCRQKADINDEVEESMLMMGLAVRKMDIISYIQKDEDFHRALFAFAGHETIWKIISNTRMHYIRFLMLDMKFPNSLEESYEDHKKIVDNIKDGNDSGLLKVLESHHDHSSMKHEEQIKQEYKEYFA